MPSFFVDNTTKRFCLEQWCERVRDMRREPQATRRCFL